MAEFYKDKSEQQIQKDIKTTFEKNDTFGIRDDQEIYSAAMKTIDSYISEVKAAKDENWGPWALKNFSDLRSNLVKEHNNLGKNESFKIMTENKKVINDLANRINNAELEVLQRLVVNRNTMKTYDANQEQKKEEKTYFTVEKSSGTLVLTKDVNAPKIHEVLGKVFKNTNDVYEIDYNGCTNNAIKQKIIALTGTGKCFISFDEAQKTYLLRNKEGQILEQRALIWEGVKLTPSAMIKFQAYTREQDLNKQKNEEIDKSSTITGTIDQVKKDPQWANIIKTIPSGLLQKLEKASNTDASIFKDFLSKTEKRLDAIIKDVKSKNYSPHPVEPVSRVYGFNNHLMEIHFINGNAKKDIAMWSGSSVIGEELYDILDDNENDYQKYLTARLTDKWGQYDHLTKHENVLGNNVAQSGEVYIDAGRKTSILYGLDIFTKMLKNIQQKEGNSLFDKDDQHIVAMQKHIQDSIHSLKQEGNVTEKMVKEKIMGPLREKRVTITNKAQTTTALDRAFGKIFSGNKEKIVEGVRYLGQESTVLSNTYTSFLKGEIADYIEISNEDVNMHFQNIGKNLEISDKDTESDIVTKLKLIDELYAAEDAKSIAKIFVRMHMLPVDLENNEKILQKCGEIKTKLAEKKKLSEQLPYTVASLAEEQKREKLALEQKDNKTEQDMVRLQTLQYLEEHPTEAEALYKNTLDGMKKNLYYSGLATLCKSVLGPTLVELGGGAKGKNANVYNDIIGYGSFNVSDENAELIGEITKEILITVVVCIATAGVGGVALQAGLRSATAAARFLRAERVAMKIIRFAEIGGSAFKTLGSTGKIVKLGYHASALMIEAPVFNSFSKIIHNSVAGRDMLADMDWSDLNPTKRENIQTAAFLGALQVAKGVHGMLIIDFGKSFEVFKNSPKWLNTTGKLSKETLTELGTMMAAEQAINVTFGREVTNPETGEVTIERGLHMPTQQEVTQMIGMILGMRATAKYNMWPKIEKKLQSGEWMITKVDKNDIGLINEAGEKSTLTAEASGKGKLFANQEQVKSQIEMKKKNADAREQSRAENDGQQTQAEKNKNTVVRMQTRSAPNKIGTRNGKAHNSVPSTPENTPTGKIANQKNMVWETKNNIKSAMDYIGVKKNNVVTIDGKKHIFVGVKNGVAEFAQQGVKNGELKRFSTIEEMQNINWEPGNKQTNAGRTEKFQELFSAKEFVSQVEVTQQINKKIDLLQNKIDKQFATNPAGRKLKNFNTWLEKQDKFELEVLKTQEMLRNVEDAHLTDAMRKLRDAGDLTQLSPNNIKRVQREIGTPADKIWGDKSHARLEEYFKRKNIAIKESSPKNQSTENQSAEKNNDMNVADIVESLKLNENPASLSAPEVISKMESVGVWLGRNVVGPSIAKLKQIKQRIGSVKNTYKESRGNDPIGDGVVQSKENNVSTSTLREKAIETEKAVDMAIEINTPESLLNPEGKGVILDGRNVEYKSRKYKNHNEENYEEGYFDTHGGTINELIIGKRNIGGIWEAGVFEGNRVKEGIQVDKNGITWYKEKGQKEWKIIDNDINIIQEKLTPILVEKGLNKNTTDATAEYKIKIYQEKLKKLEGLKQGASKLEQEMIGQG